MGKIRIDRKGYVRRGYTRKDGTRVKAVRVAPSRFSIRDTGRPGRGARGAERGPFRKEKPFITAAGRGGLGGHGYAHKSEHERHALLQKSVKKVGYKRTLGRVSVLLRSTELHHRTRALIEHDRRWLVHHFGGPGSFGPRVKRRANRVEGPFRPGQRIELHPGTDRWMMGDRYGVVVRMTKTGAVKVKLDRSGKTIDFHPSNVMEMH